MCHAIQRPRAGTPRGTPRGAIYRIHKRAHDEPCGRCFAALNASSLWLSRAHSLSLPVVFRSGLFGGLQRHAHGCVSGHGDQVLGAAQRLGREVRAPHAEPRPSLLRRRRRRALAGGCWHLTCCFACFMQLQLPTEGNERREGISLLGCG